MRAESVILVLLCVPLDFGSAGCAREDAGPESGVLELDRPLSGRLGRESGWEQTFVLDVTDELLVLELKLASEDAELDLSVTAPGAPETLGHHHAATTEAGCARMRLDRVSEPPLAPGLWRVHVGWPHAAAPQTADASLDAVGFTLAAHAFGPREDGRLEPGVDVAGTIERATGGFRMYAVDVPAHAAALRVDILETPGDLDLAVGRGPAGMQAWAERACAQNGYGRETIVVTPDGPLALAPGPWLVEVFDPRDAEYPVPFRLRVRFAEEPAADQLVLPTSLATDQDAALGFPLAAIVALETTEGGGSGCVLTADGWMLTNAHVVALRGEATARTVIVAVTLAADRPPVEHFRAEVIDSDEDLDLALLRIVAGFHGQPLPPGMRFPHVVLGSGDALHIGDPLRLVGFADTGGLGTRVTVSVTAGIISGFEAVPSGRVVKTDAEITSGNSGGAALDARGRLAGIPTSRVESGSGQLGYVHPVDWIPEAWLRRAGLERPRAR